MFAVVVLLVRLVLSDTVFLELYLEADAEFRGALKKAGFLTRDARMKERKKYGLKAARRAPSSSQRDNSYHLFRPRKSYGFRGFLYV